MTKSEVVALIAFAAAVVVTPIAALVAMRLGVVDRPGELKPQQRAVPYLGGIGVFAALLAGVTAVKPVLVLPLALAAALGTIDDLLDIAPLVRLGGQILIGVVIGITLTTRVETGLSIVLISAMTVLLMNGVNLIDGLDCLAGGVAAACGGGFALMLHGAGRTIGIALALGAIGFLIYNRPPARVYLGDGGSYLIGAVLAVLVAYAWSRQGSSEVAISSLVVVAVPVAEVALAVFRRFRSGTSMTAGDRGHPYDRLVQRGWNRLASAGVYVVIEIVLAAVATLVSRTHDNTAPVASAAVVAVGVGVVAVGQRVAARNLQS